MTTYLIIDMGGIRFPAIDGIRPGEPEDTTTTIRGGCQTSKWAEGRKSFKFSLNC